MRSGALSKAKAIQPARQRKPRAPNAAPIQLGHRRSDAPLKNSDVIYNEVKREIVSLLITPGTPISEKDIAVRYKVSRTPAREAVLRLVDDRLVDVVPKSGTFVSRIPLSAVREAIVARKALEGVTVRAATARASVSDIMELRAIIQRQKECADAGKEEAFHRADEDFHAAIARIGGYPGIWDMILQFKLHVDRYRRVTLAQPGRMHIAVNEHATIVDCLERRDPAGTTERMDFHLSRLRLDITVFRDLCPDYFIFDTEAGVGELD